MGRSHVLAATNTFVVYYFVKSMKLKFCLSLSAASILSAFSFGVETAIASPTTDAHGNWQSPIAEETWVVTDPDPNGLNCRMLGTFGLFVGAYNRGASVDVLSMPVVTTLPRDEAFSVEVVSDSVAGSTETDVLFYDGRNLPWVFLLQDRCFVRANEAFIAPLSTVRRR